MPRHLAILGLFILLGVLAPPALAQGVAPNGAVDYNGLLPAALTLLLPLGLILLISSAVPEDEAPATAINLLMVWSVAALAYFGVGFAFQFGGIAQVTPNPQLSGLYWEWYPLDQSVDVEVARLWGVVALRGWALTGEAATPAGLHLFLSHISLVGVAAIVPAGVLLLRARGVVALLAALLTGALIYPVAGNWLWGGGWLSNLGASLGLGHGLVDFGGAGLLFLTGSATALIGLILFRAAPAAGDGESTGAEVVIAPGPEGRLTVYEEPAGQPESEPPLPVVPMPSAYLPILSVLGGGLMLLGWFGIASGVHAPTALNFTPAYAGVNGLLAALAAALAAAGYSWFTTRHFDPLMTARGLVAGLIVAMAGAPFVPVWICLLAALLMGAALPPLVYLFNQGLRLADELGALPTYGVSAVVSLLLVALFADGHAGQGWNNTGAEEYLGVAGQGVSGLVVTPAFVIDWPGQLQAQLLGLGAILVWALLLSFLLLQTVRAVADAWARTGLELADSSAGASLAHSDDLPDEQSDSQLTLRS